MTRKSLGTRVRASRKPHNARTNEYVSFDEILDRIATEPRTALVGDQQVVMSRDERLMRLTVDRALKKNAREVVMLLKVMAENPSIAATYREEFVTVISGSLAKLT